MMKEAAKSNLRLIAPKLEQSLPQEEQQQQQQQQQPQSPQQPPRLSPSPPPQLLEQQQKIVFTSDSPPAMSCGSSNTSSCCSTKSNNPATTSSNCCSTKTVNTNTTSTTTSTTASQHKDGNDNTTTSSNICPPSGCGCGIKEILPSEMSSHLESSSPSSSSCGTKASSSSSSSSSPPTEASSGRVRIVTCRCGDSCACPGCDAHPSRVMKGQNDPYTGFATDDVRRRLSIAAICLPSDAPPSKRSSEQPTSILREDGIELCGCGCSQTFDACSDCFRELCH
ncbi:hypothetical protein BDB00DRAFT_534 [Zychaea mexicana]|uniref:uncharacterized protein n=1 Tax=Zychaea mexicana TaxID=64656 RepID=UPI0022FE84FA|nr:uncharacterized protein BDB00DRAFT_534 [Zychaea mexicana]KAI9499437.1 hypothetical protein BDB00DRAFT_534 [Zychaea mexicana]